MALWAIFLGLKPRKSPSLVQVIIITIFSYVLLKKGSENLSTPLLSTGDNVLVHMRIMWVWLTGRQQMEIISSEEMTEESGKYNDPQAERLSDSPAVFSF